MHGSDAYRLYGSYTVPAPRPTQAPYWLVRQIAAHRWPRRVTKAHIEAGFARLVDTVRLQVKSHIGHAAGIAAPACAHAPTQDQSLHLPCGPLEKTCEPFVMHMAITWPSQAVSMANALK